MPVDPVAGLTERASIYIYPSLSLAGLRRRTSVKRISRCHFANCKLQIAVHNSLIHKFMNYELGSGGNESESRDEESSVDM